ncbi:MAG TPA: DUF4156 domain-containing protein [Methylococcaceae bacterium]|jgi:hypothetical protein|nr:DUF4156 domain-containing protein [Methylococcaceae bacterium]
MRKVLSLLASVTLAGCAATPLMSGAERVDVVTGIKEVKKCSYLGDVVGSQGNRFSGPFTPTANLLLGARQALKNETMRLGGNKVLLQQQQYSQRELFGGTIDAVLVGKAYKCMD